MTFGIGHPPPIHQLQTTCVGEGSRSQIFKQNSIISILSKVMAFLVILLSPWSPRCPHIVPVIPTSSPCYPHCPHVVPIVPRRSSCGPHGCGLHCLRGLHPMLSPWSPCCPHIIPVIPMSSPCHPHHPHIIPIAPRRFPCGLHGCGLRGLRCLRGLHPMLSPWSPHHPRRPHVIPVSFPLSPHHLEGPHIIPNPPDTHFTHLGVGGPKSVKMQ